MVHADYDLVLETSHLHQIEAPEQCREAMLEFLDEIGFQEQTSADRANSWPE